MSLAGGYGWEISSLGDGAVVGGMRWALYKENASWVMVTLGSPLWTNRQTDAMKTLPSDTFVGGR